MRYSEFERIISAERMNRYVEACGGNTRKAMTLYRYNLQLSQEMFTIISCFEVALRNGINAVLSNRLGEEWLKDTIMPMRNRIAHHEPVCFYLQDTRIDTTHVLSIYLKMQRLFAWMGIDSHALLYGLDHVQQVCEKINELKE